MMSRNRTYAHGVCYLSFLFCLEESVTHATQFTGLYGHHLTNGDTSSGFYFYKETFFYQIVPQFLYLSSYVTSY